MTDLRMNVSSLCRVDGDRLARNTLFNLIGQVLPLCVGILLIPFIVRGLGPDRFGMLGLMWIVFGYFGLMDFGLGRATTKFLAEWLARGDSEHIAEMVWSSVLLQVLLGIVGGVLIAGLTPVLVHRLKTTASLQVEACTASYILAAALPFVLAGSALRAVLEGCQRFDIANVLRIPSSILNYAIPAVGVFVGWRLPGIILWMAVSRVLFMFAHGAFCLSVLPCLRVRPSFHSKILVPLLSFGGWVTASNIVNPILLSMERFILGSIVSVGMVGYYTPPAEAVSNLLLVPESLTATVYPTCSGLGPERKGDLQNLYSRLVRYIFCALAPIGLVLIIFARPIINLWLGPAFVDKSAVPLQLLAVGIFINSFAHVPYCFLQALGRPDTAAKLFLCELIPYGLLAWWMVERAGIVGAAAAWSIRVTVEVVFLIWIAQRVFSLSPWEVMDRRMGVALAALSGEGVGLYTTNLFLQAHILIDGAVAALWLAAFALVVWKWVLDGADRASALSLLAPLRGVFERSFQSAEAD